MEYFVVLWFAGFSLYVVVSMRWMDPNERFITYEPKDEGWCRACRNGREVKEPVFYRMAEPSSYFEVPPMFSPTGYSTPTDEDIMGSIKDMLRLMNCERLYAVPTSLFLELQT